MICSITAEAFYFLLPNTEIGGRGSGVRGLGLEFYRRTPDPWPRTPNRAGPQAGPYIPDGRGPRRKKNG